MIVYPPPGLPEGVFCAVTVDLLNEELFVLKMQAALANWGLSGWRYRGADEGRALPCTHKGTFFDGFP